ncbi:MAG: lamin tail domain-containing protein [Candidatus Nealsonbacteria bacterium]|nr:lamin tail domain-containing protein [Candidatus Nealsonbacteria bacterium]
MDSDKIKSFFRREGRLLVITLVIAFLFASSFQTAKAQISDETLDKIEEFLKLSNLPEFLKFSKEDIKKILKKEVDSAILPDFTYEMYISGIINEVDFLDYVLSQRYKEENREYFNRILNNKLNLVSYWKKTGKDISSLLKQGSSASPISVLALQSVEMTNNVVEILGVVKTLEDSKRYDGLWYYFDQRKNGHEPHDVVWGEAKYVMGFASKSTSFRRPTIIAKDMSSEQLELQFATLYDEWGKYATPYGLSDDIKEQVREEVETTLVMAAEEYRLVQEKKKEKEALLPRRKQLPRQGVENILEGIAKQIEDIKVLLQKGRGVAAALASSIQESVSQITPFGETGLLTSVVLEPIAETAEMETSEARPLPDEAEGNPLTLDESQEDLDDISERIEDLTPEIIPEPVELAEVEPLLIEPPEAIEEFASATSSEEIVWCKTKLSTKPARDRVILSEISWAGTPASVDNEWFELKNISLAEVNLTGWQILDKDGQIKIAISSGGSTSANGFYVLERQSDEVIPNVKADLIYEGPIEDRNEAIYLFDQDCQLQDLVEANPDWPAGDPNMRSSMERGKDFSWHTYLGYAQDRVFGTPKSESSPEVFVFTPPAPKEDIKILITEIGTDHSSSTDYDFIEFYNPNNKSVDISGFQLKKRVSTGTEYSIKVFQEASIIASKTYYIWANSNYSAAGLITANATTTQTLAANNSVALLDADKKVIDEIAWGTSTNPFLETKPFPSNPDDKKSLSRKWVNSSNSYQDSNNNAEDFELKTFTPGARSSEENGGGGGNSEETPTLEAVINEIAWMGTKASAQDEWIELYNNTTSSIDLDGWRLVSSDGGPDIVFSSTTATTTSLIAKGFYLVERTNNNTISDIFAEWTGSFGSGLHNTSCEVLSLYDKNNKLIDKTACLDSSGWPAGIASPNYISMERINSTSTGTSTDNWANNNRITKNGLDANGTVINGTPKSQNSVSKNKTEISGVLDFTEDFTLTYLGSPYFIDGSINVASTTKLTIEPGVIIKFKDGFWDSQFKVTGSLLARGEADKKIVFTSSSTSPTAGDWQWLYLENASTTLENVAISYAGKREEGSPPLTYGSIYVDGGNLTLKNSTIEQSGTIGVWIRNSTSTIIDGVTFDDNNNISWGKPAAVYVENSGSTIKNSTFTNNNIGILVENFSAPAIENNSFTNNQKPIQIGSILPNISGNAASSNTDHNGISLDSLTLPGAQTSAVWRNAGLPYVVNTLYLASGVNLTMEASTTIKFLDQGNIEIAGTLQALGEPQNKITFTSVSSSPTAGSWKYILFNSSSANSLLRNTIISYGGGYLGAVRVSSGSLSVENSIFDNNLYSGLYLDNASSTVSGTLFKNHSALGTSKGINVFAGSCPVVSGLTFGSGAESNSIDIYPETCNP